MGDKPAAVLVPLSGAPPTFHTGQFAGFVDRAAAVAFVIREPWTPAATMPAAGAAYALPSLDELIAAEQGLNPGRTVLGKASREAVDGDTIRRTFEVTRDKPGAGSAYLDCIGPSSVTVSSGANTTTSPCLRAGSYGSHDRRDRADHGLGLGRHLLARGHLLALGRPCALRNTTGMFGVRGETMVASRRLAALLTSILVVAAACAPTGTGSSGTSASPASASTSTPTVAATLTPTAIASAVPSPTPFAIKDGEPWIAYQWV